MCVCVWKITNIYKQDERKKNKTIFDYLIGTETKTGGIQLVTKKNNQQ